MYLHSRWQWKIYSRYRRGWWVAYANKTVIYALQASVVMCNIHLTKLILPTLFMAVYHQCAVTEWKIGTLTPLARQKAHENDFYLAVGYDKNMLNIRFSLLCDISRNVVSYVSLGCGAICHFKTEQCGHHFTGNTFKYGKHCFCT